MTALSPSAPGPDQHAIVALINLNARIAEIRDEGPDKVNVRLMIGPSHVLLWRITRRSRDHLGLVVGMEVFAQAKSVAMTT